MLIKITLKGLLTGEEKVFTCDDITSPTGGYTQEHMDSVGLSYENGRGEELFGDHDYWNFVSAEKSDVAIGF